MGNTTGTTNDVSDSWRPICFKEELSRPFASRKLMSTRQQAVQIQRPGADGPYSAVNLQKCGPTTHQSSKTEPDVSVDPGRLLAELLWCID